MRARLKSLRSDEIEDLSRFAPAAPDEFRIAWDHPAVKELWETPNG